MFWEVHIFARNPKSISKEMRQVIRDLKENLQRIIRQEYGADGAIDIKVYKPSVPSGTDSLKSDICFLIVADGHANSGLDHFNPEFLAWFATQARNRGAKDTYSITVVSPQLNEVH